MSQARKVVLWDYDDTLVYGWFNQQTRHLQGQPMPGTVETIAHLHRQRVQQAVLSNQAGILYGLFQDEIMKRNPAWQRKDYPTIESLAGQIAISLKELGLVCIYIAIWDERLRWLLMPSEREMQNFEHMPGSESRLPLERASDVCHSFERLLLAQDIQASVSVQSNWRKPETGMFDQVLADFAIPKEQRSLVSYVGDLPTDEEAAKNAGVNFTHASQMSSLLAEN